MLKIRYVNGVKSTTLHLHLLIAQSLNTAELKSERPVFPIGYADILLSPVFICFDPI